MGRGVAHLCGGDAVVQAQPEEEPAGWLSELEIGLAELLQRGAEHSRLLCIQPPHRFDVRVEVAAHHVFVQHPMQQRAVAHVEAGRQQRVDPLGAGLHPADPQARRDHLGEGADGEDAIAEAEFRERRRRWPIEVELRIGVVLHDEDAAPGGDIEQVDAPLLRHGQAGRVVEGGLGVDQLRGVAVGLDLVERGLEAVDADAVVVHLDPDHARLLADQRSQRSGEGWDFGDHHIAGVEQRCADCLDRARCAVGHQVPVGVGLRGVVAREEAGDRFTQRFVAARAAVDQRRVAGGFQHASHGFGELRPRHGVGVGDAGAERDWEEVAGRRDTLRAPVGHGA